MRFMVIGTGFAETHIKWIQETDSAVVAVLAYQQNIEKAKELAKCYGIPRITNDPLQVIASGEIDAIAVVTPPDTHEPLILAGLAHHLLVVSDKPLAQSAKVALSLANKAREMKASANTMLQWRTHPALKALQQRYKAGKIGSLIHVSLEFHHDFLAGPNTNWPWRHVSQQGGAGSLGDQGVHLFDLLRFFAPYDWQVASSVTSTAWLERMNNQSPIACDTEDVADVFLINTENSAKARVFVSRVNIGYREILVRVQGTSGSINIALNPDDGSGYLLFKTLISALEKIHYAASSLSPYKSVLASLPHQNLDSSLRPADFDDGYAIQVLLEEAIRLAK